MKQKNPMGVNNFAVLVCLAGTSFASKDRIWLLQVRVMRHEPKGEQRWNR